MDEKYAIYEKYDVECRLKKAEFFCNKYDGAPCCFFCMDKDNCDKSCQNDPTICCYSVCRDKKGG